MGATRCVLAALAAQLVLMQPSTAGAHANQIVAGSALGNGQVWPPPQQLQQGVPQSGTVPQQQQQQQQQQQPPLQRAAKTWTTWVNNASTAVADALKQATSATTQNSRPQKLAKGSEGKSAADPPVTTAYVQDMVSAGVAAAMQAMSQASHERFQHIEDNIGTLAVQQNQLGEKNSSCNRI